MVKISVILPTYRRNNQQELDNLHNYNNFINTATFGEEFKNLYIKYVNGSKHILKPTLKCLEKQTFRDFEVLLCHKYPEDTLTKELIFDMNLKVLEEKPSIWHSLGNYATVNNNRNTGIINAQGELLFFLDDMTIFNENLLSEVWDNYQNGFYTTCQVIKRIKVVDDKIQGNYKLKGLEKNGLLNNSSTWTYGMSISLKETLKINGFDEIYDGSFGGTDIDFGRRLSLASRYQRKIGPIVYEFTHYSEQKKRSKVREDEVLRVICNQAPIPKIIKANSWKPTETQMKMYENFHIENVGELDKNWNKCMEVPLYDINKIRNENIYS